MNQIQAAAIQFPVSMDVRRNVATLESLLLRLPSGALAVAPEGSLSGYMPEPGFVKNLDHDATRTAIDTMKSLCRQRGVHLIAGACVLESGNWLNSSFYFGPDGEQARYDKINLAQSERETFVPGDTLPVFDLHVNGEPVRVGIQMCREIRYPEQWRALASQGAQVIAYVNNAVGSKRGDALWRAHMISRAAETQRFVIGANNAAADQTCPTMIVAPSGEPLAEVRPGVEDVAVASLSLQEVSDWVLAQSRDDVVRVTLAE